MIVTLNITIIVSAVALLAVINIGLALLVKEKLDSSKSSNGISTTLIQLSAAWALGLVSLIVIVIIHLAGIDKTYALIIPTTLLVISFLITIIFLIKLGIQIAAQPRSDTNDSNRK